MNVQVFLRSGYLARYVNLRVGKTSNGRRWEIQAYDGNGMFTTDVTVDGQRLPEFTTMRDAMAVLDTLPKERIWATSDRVAGAYVDFAHSAAGKVQAAAA